VLTVVMMHMPQTRMAVTTRTASINTLSLLVAPPYPIRMPHTPSNTQLRGTDRHGEKNGNNDVVSSGCSRVNAIAI